MTKIKSLTNVLQAKTFNISDLAFLDDKAHIHSKKTFSLTFDFW